MSGEFCTLPQFGAESPIVLLLFIVNFDLGALSDNGNLYIKMYHCESISLI